MNVMQVDNVMKLSRRAGPALALAALAAAACRTAAPAAPASASRVEPDSCADVRERVRGTGFIMADVAPVESPRNRPLPELTSEDDAGGRSSPFMIAYVITATGAVDEATIRTIGTVPPRVDQRLAETVRRWRFTPARYHGCVVPHAARDSFTFRAKR